MKTGKDPRWPVRYREWMIDAGFEGVTEKVSNHPHFLDIPRCLEFGSKICWTDIQMARKPLAEGRKNEGDWRLDAGKYARRPRRIHLSTVYQGPRVDHGGGGGLPCRREEGPAEQEDSFVLEDVSVTAVKLV